MNTRSLRFQLVVWYAGVLLAAFVLLGVATYAVLRDYMTAEVREAQMRRARQIAQLVAREDQQRAEQVGEEIEARYAPAANDRLVRITRVNRGVLYLSGTPVDRPFDPAVIPPPAPATGTEQGRVVPLPEGRQLLVAVCPFKGPGGAQGLVEVGALMDAVQADLRQLLKFLVGGLPVVTLVAVGGGIGLVKRALLPVDRVAAQAERISLHNLGERLPVAPTGDELERLTVAVNHMIERLAEAFEHSRRFMADASHELRTPFTILRGELESFVQDDRLAPDLRQRAASALEEVERLSKIVEGLFAISRLDAGEAQAEWVKFDLAQLATATADQMFLLAEDKNIRIECAAEKGVWVQGDRARLKQVVVNLLDNAIKYTPAGGSVTLAVGTKDQKALLEVKDDGIGIAPEALPHVFERFFRVDKARSREPGGAGLGLSIVRSICHAHGGVTEVTSEINHGSRFAVRLPLATPNGQPNPA